MVTLEVINLSFPNPFFSLPFQNFHTLKILKYKEKKKKKLQIVIHIALKNYKYTKSLFLNTLWCNHLLIKKKIKIKNKQTKLCFFFFLILSCLGFFFFWVEIRAFTVVVLEILAFSTSKNYFIYFTTPLYNTPNIKCSNFLPFHLQ